MASRTGQLALRGLFICLMALVTAFSASQTRAAPYAAMVMDARTGEVLHSRNADTRLHPASLTKMMTLYIAFQAIQRGEISLDSEVRITAAAAAEPPSKLGLRTGQTIRLRYLLRAAAVKSANDAATAIGIAISGSESAFAERMTRTAASMGMSNTTFRNAHGLTQSGHMSTARDMSVLGRHVIYDFPQYYNLFSRRTADAGIATVSHTNRRFLNSYEGADGIKPGYTRAAGFNLVASAQRGQERVIATIFGGRSTATRTQRIIELMDMGFQRTPSNATIRAPQMPGASIANSAPAPAETVAGTTAATNGGAGKTIRVSGIISSSPRPQGRPVSAIADADLAVDTDVINDALAEVLSAALNDVSAAPKNAEIVAAVLAEEAPSAEVIAAVESAIAPQARPTSLISAAAQVDVAQAVVEPTPEMVTRVSTSGGRHWGVNVGRYNSRYEAERVLLKVALNEMTTLDGSLRRVTQRSGGFDANFMGLTREGADLACRRLQARGTTCFMIGSDS